MRSHCHIMLHHVTSVQTTKRCLERPEELAARLAGLLSTWWCRAARWRGGLASGCLAEERSILGLICVEHGFPASLLAELAKVFPQIRLVRGLEKILVTLGVDPFLRQLPRTEKCRRCASRKQTDLGTNCADRRDRVSVASATF